ncbi:MULTISPECIES: excisionase [unclassified Brucella]|uniref:helix-turn-helix transcriptional regulator n=1 Tax=Brucella TaxID=234 RepID=UPI0012ADA4F3|nr:MULTISPECIES: excisionase [unclassified Brucella]MRN43272.1 excisionase [Brucella sp. 09RB8913]MRN58566.1 excisionase [Brucella sp. 09RB8918]
MSCSNLTIQQFCERFNLSPSTYYRLKRDGLGPRELRVGRRVIIPAKIADEWAEALISQAS